MARYRVQRARYVGRRSARRFAAARRSGSYTRRRRSSRVRRRVMVIGQRF